MHDDSMSVAAPTEPTAAQRRRARRRVGLTASLAVASALMGTTAVAAPTSWLQHQTSANGRVMRGVDGDTESIDAWGDGIVMTESVRNAGIQAMETGQCHAAEATAAMNALTLGKQVRMSATYASSSSLGRPVRFVDVLTPTGYLDPQLSLLNAGHALPLVIPPETGRWKTYFTAAEKAAAAHKNLWDPTYCGSGPSQSTPISLWVNYDGDGDERLNVNTEYIRIRNLGTVALPLDGWWVRSAAQDSYWFPKGTRVQPGSTLTLRVGKGTNTATTLYWGYTTAHFKNVDETGGFGDGGYLYDPDGDVRAHAIYPCLYACSDSLQGKVNLSVNYDAPGDDVDNPNGEYVVVSPRSTTPIDLAYKVLSVGSSTYEIPRGTVVNPGEELVVRMGKGTSSRLMQFWGRTNGVMVNTGGAMILRSTEDVRIACTAWGTGRC